MLNPKNSFRMCWDIGLIMPFLLYLATLMPFRLAFENEAKMFSPIYWFEFIIDLLFIIDIVFNFRTGILLDKEAVATGAAHEEQVEYDRYRVAKDYLGSWLILDVVSGVPFALVDLLQGGGEGTGSAGALKSAKVLKLLRFLKLGRLLKVEKILSNLDRDTLDRVEDFLQNGSTRSALVVLQLLLILGYANHLLACGWVAVGRSTDRAGVESWLHYELNGPFNAMDTMKGRDPGSIYISAFYFCLTTMISVGYGDILPRNDTEKIYVIILEGISAIVFAMIIASITSVVTSMDMNTRKTAEQLDAVASLLIVREIPEGLARRIRRHFRHYYSVKSAIDETKIFSELSTALRKELALYLVQDLMGSESFFNKMPQVLWPRLLPLLSPMSFDKEEVVCSQGEEVTEMNVILSGSLTGSTWLDDEPEQRHRRIRAGSDINVLCVLGIWDRCIETVVALEAVQTYAVSAKDFISLFTSEMDLLAYESLQQTEGGALFRFDPEPGGSTPTAFGRPLCYACFSILELTVRRVKRGRNKGGGPNTDSQRGGVSGSKTPAGTGSKAVLSWVVVDLIDLESGRLIGGDVWSNTTVKVISDTTGVGGDPIWAEDTIRWTDIAHPFGKAGIRLKYFEADAKGLTVEQGHGAERLTGGLVLRLKDLRGGLHARDSVSGSTILDPISSEETESLDPPSTSPLKPEEKEAWYTLDPIDDAAGAAGLMPIMRRGSSFLAGTSSSAEARQRQSLRRAAGEAVSTAGRDAIKLRSVALRPEKRPESDGKMAHSQSRVLSKERFTRAGRGVTAVNAFGTKARSARTTRNSASSSQAGSALI